MADFFGPSGSIHHQLPRSRIFYSTLSNHFLHLLKMLSILRKARLKDKEMRILLLLVFYLLCWASSSLTRRGLDAAGKTTICKKLLNENIEEVSPTLGFIIRTIEYDGLVTPWMIS